MAFEAFDIGVAPDGVKDTTDVKILICFLLKNVDNPLSFENISEILLKDELVNYFELAAAIDELLESGHIDLVKKNGQDYYKSTKLGIGTAELFKHRLPYSVKEKTANAASELVSKIKRESENSVEIKENTDGGLNVCCKILDMNDTLMSINLLVPFEKQAQLVKKHFLANPELFYKGVLAMLTGNSDDINALLKSQKESDKK